MTDLGQQLFEEMSGCKLEITSFSSRKKFTDGQRNSMASFFDSDAKSVSGGREILNKKLPEVKAVYAIIRQARAIWQGYTVKYEDGMRLIKIDRIEWMNQQIATLQADLQKAKEALYEVWDQVKQDARNRLAKLYVEGDYNFDVRQAIWLTISYPSVQPDPKLAKLGKELFDREMQKFAIKFDEAAQAAEQALREEFAGMIAAVAERLESGESEDGKKRVLQQRAVDNIVEFANRFRAISVGDNAELDALVHQAEQLAVGLDAKAMKKDDEQRANMREAFAKLQSAVSAHVVKQAERSIEFE
jgi:hypothetical protein